MGKVTIEIYVKENCSLCQEVKVIVDKVRKDMPFLVKEVDITSNEDLFRKYKEDIPMIFINGKKTFKYKVDEQEFKKKVRKEIIKARVSLLARKRLNCDSGDY